jgi:hypothetical protein
VALTGDPVPLTFAGVREIALALPGVEEGTSYGTPSLRVRKRFLARLHEDGESLVLKVDPAVRGSLVDADPVTFSVTDHLESHPYVLVRLSTAGREEVRSLFEAAWRREAPQALVRACDAGQIRDRRLP